MLLPLMFRRRRLDRVRIGWSGVESVVNGITWYLGTDRLLKASRFGLDHPMEENAEIAPAEPRLSCLLIRSDFIALCCTLYVYYFIIVVTLAYHLLTSLPTHCIDHFPSHPEPC